MKIQVAITVLAALAGSLQASVVINEIMYYPTDSNINEQWVELYNPQSTPVDISGWQIDKGVQITFPEGTTIAPNGYLVVAADKDTFTHAYPNVANYVAGWSGKLSHKGETLRLIDKSLATVDVVTYSHQGEWGERQLLLDQLGSRDSWEWVANHNGLGYSLELVNPDLSNEIGQNWNASTVIGGTPGKKNSTSLDSSEQAPLITGVQHYPILPKSDQTVTISAQVHSLNPNLEVYLCWKISGETSFRQTPMALTGENTFAAILPEQSDGTTVEFYITAETGDLKRVYPNTQTAEKRSSWLIYRVQNEQYTGKQPILHIVLSPEEKYYLEQKIWAEMNTSEANVNGTLIYQPANGELAQVYYQAGFRNRGKGTAANVPHNIHITVPQDNLWEGRSTLNANTKDVHCQVVASVLSRFSGVPMAECRPIQIRINGENLANATAPQYGSYAGNEPVDGNLVEREWPDDAEGNVYRCKRVIVSGGYISADLVWRGTNYQSYVEAYPKKNNTVENDWSDLISLVYTLNNTPDAEYVEKIQQRIDVDEWMRYFAFNTLIGNQETSLATGVGDDYAMFCGKEDPRFQLISYDMDAVLGLGERTEIYKDGIWRMNGLPVIKKLMIRNEFASLYFKNLYELATSVFAPENLNAILDRTLGGWVPQETIDNMKTFNAKQVAYVLSQIPREFSITTKLEEQNGYPMSTSLSLTLTGTADVLHTQSVTVNGVPATYTAWQGTWSANLKLNPGLNLLIIRALDEDGYELEYQEKYILCPCEIAHQIEGGTIIQDATWSAAEGPWVVTKDLTIGKGVTLTIEPGTSVYLGTNVTLEIAKGGCLRAEGTESKPIIISGIPGGARWKWIYHYQSGVNNANGIPENRLVHVHIKDNDTVAIRGFYGVFLLDHLTFGSHDRQYVGLDGCSFMISHCRFPSATTEDFQLLRNPLGTLLNGRGVFYRNFFGRTYGHNDPADCTDGSNAKFPKFQFIENVFLGSGDDLLDLDGTDAWVEGNILMHAHQYHSYGGASAISGGRDGSRTSQNFIRGNLFYDNDFAAKAKDGNFHVMVNNTIVRNTLEGSQDKSSGMLGCYDSGYPEAKGYFLEDNICYDINSLLWGHTSSIITLNHNILQEEWDTSPEWARGGNNSLADPMFNYIPQVGETTNFLTWNQAQIMKKWFATKNSSPAKNTGYNGGDRGFTIKRGVPISGEPKGVNTSGNVTLKIGCFYNDFGISIPYFANGAGYLAYKYRINHDGEFGEWSEEIPSTQPLSLENLENGEYFVEVSGKKHVGMWDDDPLMGEALYVARSETWTVDRNGIEPETTASLLISELDFAGNQVEIYNFGTESIALDKLFFANQTQILIPVQSGGIIEAGAYTIVPCSLLKKDGGVLNLYCNEALCDQVQYGFPVAGYTLGRMNLSAWTLCQPTLGKENISIPLGNENGLKINEWLASEQSGVYDWIELYNDREQPVLLSGLYLSDGCGSLARFQIGQNSFIAPKGFAVFIADGKEQSGSNHLSFKLSADKGSIYLSDKDLTIIDSVVYENMEADRSLGRSPDGAIQIVQFTTPTPGNKNLCVYYKDQVVTQEDTLFGMEGFWHYDESGTNLGTAWRYSNYDDSDWKSGYALLYNEGDPLPAAKKTKLKLGPITYYFRGNFVVTEEQLQSWMNPNENWDFQLKTILDDGAVFYLNGEEISRVNMNEGSVNYLTLAPSHEACIQGPFSLSLSNLVVGTNLFAIELHQDKKGSSDAVMGAELKMVTSITNRISNIPQLRISEIFAAGESFAYDGVNICDWVEFYNPNDTVLDLSGMSVSDDLSEPAKWVFPEGTILNPEEYLVLPCSQELAGQGFKQYANFNLGSTGDSVYLLAPESEGGALIDSVVYGIMVADYSISRNDITKDDWGLSVPTPKNANKFVELATNPDICINEWMAQPKSGSDWFELYNRGEYPTEISGYYLTDDLANLSQYRIPAHSFIGTGDSVWMKIIADEELEKGANHVNFKLSGSGETLALVNPLGSFLDILAFGQQQKGISQGRYPDGSEFVYDLEVATPGAKNILKKDPIDEDYDKDGMPNAWEEQYGLDPYSAKDALQDKDGDGQTNLNEYLAGTDPTDPESVFKIKEIMPTEDSLILTISTGKTGTYIIENQTDGGSWKVSETFITSENGSLVVIWVTPSQEGTTLYRVYLKE